MTVIAAAQTRAGVIIAADAQITAGWNKKQHAVAKLWISGQYAMGVAGRVRTAQILRHHASWPKYHPDEDDLERFAVTQLVPAMKTAARDNGVLHTSNGIETTDSELLLSMDDEILTIGSDGSVLIDPTGRMAIGSGAPEALGLLGDRGPWTETDVIRAVYRATITDLGCSGPIVVANARKLKLKLIQLNFT